MQKRSFLLKIAVINGIAAVSQPTICEFNCTATKDYLHYIIISELKNSCIDSIVYTASSYRTKTLDYLTLHEYDSCIESFYKELNHNSHINKLT